MGLAAYRAVCHEGVLDLGRLRCAVVDQLHWECIQDQSRYGLGGLVGAGTG